MFTLSGSCEGSDDRILEVNLQKRSAGAPKYGMQEVMLHETVVSWLRRRLTESLPTREWEETPEAFGARLRATCADVNATLNVEGLCSDFPKRIRLSTARASC